MSKSIYESGYVTLADNTQIEIKPLKLKHFKPFMNAFDTARLAKNEDDLIDILVECAAICMRQFDTKLSTPEALADNVSLPAIYDILYFAGNIKMGQWEEKRENKEEATGDEKSSWETLDLNKLEAEVFMIGAWKNYEELEESLSMAELLLTIEAKRDLDYQEKKFMAAMQGVDLDQNSQTESNEDPWEALKARVAAKAAGMGSENPNDITSYQGVRAAQAGFGIGMGLDYATDI